MGHSVGGEGKTSGHPWIPSSQLTVDWQYRGGTLTRHLRVVGVMFRREGQDGGSAVERSIQVMSQSLLPFSLPCDFGALGLNFPICKTGIILIMLGLLRELNEIVLGI